MVHDNRALSSTYIIAFPPLLRQDVVIVELTDEQLKKWKETFDKDSITYNTDEEYREAVINLIGYFDVLIQMDLEQKATSKES